MAKSEIINKCSACINLTDKPQAGIFNIVLTSLVKKFAILDNFMALLLILKSGLIRAHVLVAVTGVRRQFEFLKSYCGVRHL